MASSTLASAAATLKADNARKGIKTLNRAANRIARKSSLKADNARKGIKTNNAKKELGDLQKPLKADNARKGIKTHSQRVVAKLYRREL